MTIMNEFRNCRNYVKVQSPEFVFCVCVTEENYEDPSQPDLWQYNGTATWINILYSYIPVSPYCNVR